MEISLYEMNELDCGIVRRIDIQGSNRKILMDMGILEGTYITVKRKAPFNGSVNILIEESNLSLRQDDAKLIFVSKE